jgi:hypothetical protein
MKGKTNTAQIREYWDKDDRWIYEAQLNHGNILFFPVWRVSRSTGLPFGLAKESDFEHLSEYTKYIKPLFALANERVSDQVLIQRAQTKMGLMVSFRTTNTAGENILKDTDLAQLVLEKKTFIGIRLNELITWSTLPKLNTIHTLRIPDIIIINENQKWTNYNGGQGQTPNIFSVRPRQLKDGSFLQPRANFKSRLVFDHFGECPTEN